MALGGRQLRSVVRGPAGAAGGAEQAETWAGRRSGFTPRSGVASPAQAPVVSGATAAYDGVWPGADLTEQVLPSGMKEDIVLTGPGAAASYSFQLTGATAKANSAGGLQVLAGGREVGTVPPLTVTTTRLAGVGGPRLTDGSAPGGQAPATVDATAAAGAQLSVSGDVVRVSVSSDLAGQGHRAGVGVPGGDRPDVRRLCLLRRVAGGQPQQHGDGGPRGDAGRFLAPGGPVGPAAHAYFPASSALAQAGEPEAQPAWRLNVGGVQCLLRQPVRPVRA